MLAGPRIFGSLAAARNTNEYVLRHGLRSSRRSSFSSSDSGHSMGCGSSQKSVASSATSQSSISNSCEADSEDWDTASYDNDDVASRYVSFQKVSSERLSQHPTLTRPAVHYNNALETITRDSQSHAGQGPEPQIKTVLKCNPRRSVTSGSWQKPSLVRENDRREVHVERLVDSSTQFVSLIWPSSDADGTSRGLVIPLRMFIKETLKRSRTSYSTLQVTLYYLAFIKSRNITSPSLQCGRRMFLTALILASKYLQDRNYSSKAWSKISGLKTSEINSNESAFLAAMDWQLHIKLTAFEQWSQIVSKCTDLAPFGASRAAWTAVVETLKLDFCFEKMRHALSSTRISQHFPITQTPLGTSASLLPMSGTANPCTHSLPLASQSSACGLSALLSHPTTMTPAAGRDFQIPDDRITLPRPGFIFGSEQVAPGRPLTPPQTPPDERSVRVAVSSISHVAVQREQRPQLRSAWPTPMSSSPTSTVSSFGSYCGTTKQDLKLPSISELVGPFACTSNFAASNGSFPCPRFSTQMTMNASGRTSEFGQLDTHGGSRGAKRTLLHDMVEDMASKRTCIDVVGGGAAYQLR